MRRVIGIDLDRTFGEVVIWEEGRLRSPWSGRHDPDGPRRAWRQVTFDRRGGDRGDRELHGGLSRSVAFCEAGW